MPRHPRPAARLVALAAMLPLALTLHGGALAQSEPVMSVEVSGLATGDVVTANEIELGVQPVGFELSAAHAGTPPVEGIGHYHLVLDGALVDMFTTPEASVSLQNVAPGPHTLMVLPAMNDHMEVMEGAAAIEFDYQPSEPLPQITAAEGTDGAPTIAIVSPAPGETVSGPVDVVVEATGLVLSEELFGKPNVEGYGHWHLFIDAAAGMGTMAGMSGTDSFTLDPSALSPGPHTLIAVLVDNLHAPFDPPIMATLDVEVAAGDDASAQAVTVSLQEWALEPAEITLPAGTHTFEARNDGTMSHALALEGEGTRAGTPDASYPAGSSQSFTVDLTPGTYELFCPVAGHKEAGMSGVLTVTG
jgi:plastocyanin